ncbi:MAG: Dethiobiotin synthetase [Myxococcaceae bacterium]|nr:Dethiobiotin synthetase [Myxococcaceae bacterium]
MRGIFVSGTGTGIGKTFVARAIAAALHASGKRVAALKPIETGCVQGVARDSEALARASGRPELADFKGFYRNELALAPYAAALETNTPPPSVRGLVDAVHLAARGSELTLVEGAGGLFVPIDAKESIAELVAALGLPLLLVAPNALGVLSVALSTAECARARGIELRAVVLVDQKEARHDLSVRTNARILDERLGAPVFEFPYTEDDDAALAVAASTSGLMAAVLDAR